MDTMKCILTRRSVRKFTDQQVDQQLVMDILEAGRWAPSGLNNQPWRFITVSSQGKKNQLAGLTKYGKIIQGAPVCIAVLIHKDSMYNDTKDHQGIGACIQNMLLAAHASGLGAVWLGEILNRASEALKILEAGDSMDLMAVIAIGHPASEKHTTARKEMTELLLTEL